MNTAEVALLCAGALLGGFTSGMTGFGFALMASGLWLLALPPVTAIPLLGLSMVAASLTALPRVARLIDPGRAIPLILGGACGVPIGILILPHVPVTAFKIAVAGMIVLNLGAAWLLSDRPALPPEAERFHPVAGFLGGVAGGISALSGVVMTIWAGLFGWTKDRRRGVFQAYNLSMGLIAVVTFALRGMLTSDVLAAARIAVPLAIGASLLGVATFLHLGNVGFSRVTNGILALSATALVLSALLGG
ncbi:MAG: sulfite exporter TauE/SafE family protein [Pseudomonadota bacterium]